jgi:hypothetical protein
VIALARPLPGARDSVALAARSGKRLVAVSRAENPGALYLFGAAFEAVVSDLREIDEAPESILYVSAAEWRRSEARRRGMRAVGPDEVGLVLTPNAFSVRRASRPSILAA